MDTDADYLAITFDTIDEGITIYDADLKLVIWNKQYEGMGITPVELLYRGSRLFDAYLDMAKRGVFGEGEPQNLAEHRIELLQNHRLIEFERLTAANRVIRIRRFRLENGGICATFRDITEERQIELQLRQRTKLDALGRLSGGVAHDLNNVLAIILANLELATENPDEYQDRVQLACDATERGATLVRSLLAFARQQELKPSVTKIGNSLDKLNCMLKPLIGDSVTLEISYGEGLWPLELDIDQFETTLVNLIVNAKDASRRGDSVSIDAENRVIDGEAARAIGINKGEYVCVSVTDNGSGMHPDTLEKAIEPFFTTKAAGYGTGLGLSMAHGFAEQSNGYLKIDSQYELGTRVNLYLPRSAKIRTLPTEKVESSMTLEGLRVLVVDDDEMVRDSIVAQVGTFGCNVSSSESGLEAMFNDDWDNVDVLISDCVMPDLDGAALAEIAVAKNPDIKVLLISGFFDESILDSKNLSANTEILRKPFRIHDLSSAIDRVIA